MRLRAKNDARKLTEMRKRFDKLIEEGSSVCDDEVSNVVEDVLNKDMKELPSTDAH